ncbi:class I SAM-dependent methyltransferase [Phenylobacterium sp.]|jgi:predicted SAM-dependent methyltransferase|uniref:class I SAM-dependent methyltransferase n=1 Tax=Phenylobacterium sp. TaxID=1871053 RepID=UPI002F402C87
MKLNLGCGFDKREGWLNLDKFAACEPDRLLDIEATPWDLPANGFDHVLMKHVLEHVGAEFAVFAAVMGELYRILEPGGLLEIHVPHVRHDSFWADPTHVRAFTPLTFQMMSKARNRQWMAAGENYTMLAFVMEVDFEIESVSQHYEAGWAERVRNGELTIETLRDIANAQWNVAQELQVRLRAVKET